MPVPDLAAPPGWDAWVAAQGPYGSLMQTTTWARVSAEVRHATPEWITVGNGSELVAGALVARYPRRLRVPARMAPRRLAPRLLCFGGPVLAEGATPAAFEQLLDHAHRVARRWSVGELAFVTPPPDHGRLEEAEAAAGFRAHGYEVAPWQTAFVDLRPTTEELLAACDRAVRKNLRRCEQAGITVTPVGAERFDQDFLAPFLASRRAAGLPRYRWIASRKLLAIDPAVFRFHVARSPAGEVLATLGMHVWGGVATEIASGRTPAGRAVGLPVQDLLHWSVMVAARSAGAELFDLGGFNPAPLDAGEEGIRRFKTKWGGHVVAEDRWTRQLGAR